MFSSFQPITPRLRLDARLPRASRVFAAITVFLAMVTLSTDAAQAQVRSTIFLTDKAGQIPFPFQPPNRATNAPGSIDNTNIGQISPKLGAFTNITTGGQACNATPCTEQGLNAAQGGAINQQGGTSATAGNPGGASSITGGTPGATGVGGAASVVGGAGGSTSGSGGAANVTGGAGTAGNGNGGDVNISGGAPNGSGIAGVIRNKSIVFNNQGAASAQNATATLTAANMTAGIITSTTAAAVSLTLPLATAMDTALPTSVATDSFDFSVINTGGTNAITMVTNTGWTLVGGLGIPANSSGRFRAAKTATGAWTLFRLS